MRHELTDYEWSAIEPKLPTKPHYIPGVDAIRRTATRLPNENSTDVREEWRLALAETS